MTRVRTRCYRERDTNIDPGKNSLCYRERERERDNIDPGNNSFCKILYIIGPGVRIHFLGFKAKLNKMFTLVYSESPLRKTASNNQLITLETEYLSRVDPFHGNYDLVTNQGDREVVESSSFRRISGESPKTVREEILKAVSPESLADKELSAGSEAGSEEEWNEERTGKNADRKIEEGKEGGVIEEKDGIKIETEDSGELFYLINMQ